MSLKRIRRNIDLLDAKLLKLLNDRMGMALMAKKFKSEIEDSDREAEILDKIRRNATGLINGPFIEKLYMEILSESKNLQQQDYHLMAFQGEHGAFGEVASLAWDSSLISVACPEFAEIFEGVQSGLYNYGIVPVENSNEGMVTHTLDRFVEFSSSICGEVLLPISHYLMNATGRFEDIKKIYSHPQPIAQCRNWLASNAPNIPVIDVASTALAAEMARDDESVAAVAGEFAASVYGLRIVESKIEDHAKNVTRFIIIGKDSLPRSGDDKTSILFSVKDEVGILYRMLEPLSKFGVNLTKIESRPLKKKAWEYVFFIDMEGHVEDETVVNAIEALKKQSKFLKVLGSYPRVRDI